MNPTIETLCAAAAAGLVSGAILPGAVRAVLWWRAARDAERERVDPISDWLRELPEVRSEDVFSEAGEDTAEVPAR